MTVSPYPRYSKRSLSVPVSGESARLQWSEAESKESMRTNATGRIYQNGATESTKETAAPKGATVDQKRVSDHLVLMENDGEIPN